MTTATRSARPALAVPPAPGFLRPESQPACREPEVDPEWFFPIGDNDESYARARAICRRCPLKVACGDWAVVEKVPDGLWGGLDPTQRKARRRAWELAP
jgi:WhiB family redox-sensing transcriptional regulator